MIRSEDLTFSYDAQKQFKFPDVNCKPKEALLILGNSGSGKTTLLHLLAGLLRPHTGSVFIGSTVLHELSASSGDSFRGRNIGLVFQKPHFVKSLNVQENLLLTQYLAGLKRDKKRIAQILERLGIGDKLNQPTHRLSQGEQQRVAIARAVLHQPKVILADEPTSALDDEHTRRVTDLLQEVAAEQNAALLIVTHDQRLKDAIPQHLSL